MSGAMTPCSRAATSPPPPRWTWRPPSAIASTALTASADRVPSAMSVSMLVARWRSSRSAFTMKGPPPITSTATARARTVHPVAADSGAERATTSAAIARGQESAARRPQRTERSVWRSRRRGSHRPRVIAGVLDRVAEGLGGQCGRVVGDEGPGRGQVDRGAGDRREPVERALHAGRTRAAVHPADLQLRGLEALLLVRVGRGRLFGGGDHDLGYSIGAAA